MFEGMTERNVYTTALNLISNENDRGAGLLAAALIETILSDLLRKRLVASPDQNDKLFSGSNSPLGTFSAKIEMAYRLGVISKDLRDLIDGLRKIRNKFAHEVFADFDIRSIQDLTENLFRIIPAHYERFTKDWETQIEIAPGKLSMHVDSETLVKVRIRFNGYFAVIVEELQGLSKHIQRIPQTRSKY